MCGIAGSYPVSQPEIVNKMIEKIRHRGPDGHAVVEAPYGALGHTRLAILDLDGGAQPMAFGDYQIAFNGEIYNYRALQTQYLTNAPLKTHSDTEVLLHLYAQLGPEMISRLDGMFAIAILKDDALFLARDPIGLKPLYTGMRDGVLYFASEIKALALITDEIHEFPAGHWYHSTNGLHRYYNLEQEASQAIMMTDRAEALEAIRTVTRQAVQKRMIADVPVGVSLSGGLDSSIIAMLARQEVDTLHTFGVGVEGCPDLAAARMVADYLGTQHHEYVYTQTEIEAALPQILYHLESFDPALVRSSIANYFLAQLTSQTVKVFLTGEGADELYAGYAYLTNYQDPAALNQELLNIVLALHNTNLQRGDRIPMAFGLEARIPFLDLQSINLAFRIPAKWKLLQPGSLSKGLLREAFAGTLPTDIIERPKQKFSQGAGSSELIAQKAEVEISDAEFEGEKMRLERRWGQSLQNKEALLYYRILRSFYNDAWIMDGMGQSRSL